MVNTEGQNNETITFTDTAKLSQDISSLYLSQKFSDITIIVDEQKLPAHKVILAVRSEYFETQLYEDAQHSQQTAITISDVSVDAFRNLLKYIYTGTITISSDTALNLQVLELAHQYSIKHLQSGLITKIKPILNLNNICAVLNTANQYDLEELQEACHAFIDSNAPELLASDCLTEMTQKSMIKLLKRDTFFAPEIEIFKNVAKWCKVNNDVDGLVIQSVRLSSLSVVEIVSIVWPSKLVDCEKLLHAIAEVVGVKPRISQPRALLMVDENIATLEHKAEVLSGLNTTWLLTGNRNVDRFAHHPIDGKSSLVVKLGAPSYFNHIKMKLWDKDARFYSYYIEVSLDQKKWRKLIDYSGISCRSDQNLYFGPQIAQYIKIMGTKNTTDPNFHLVFFEPYYKNEVPKSINGIVCPDTNVATADRKAIVIEGTSPNFLINGDTKNYNGSTGFTYHTIGSGSILVQLAQPYMISSMRLLLWDQDARSYRYFIETSVNNTDWEIVVDKRNGNCQSWQNLRFKERAVVFVKITGTLNTVGGGFHCVHFECPSEVGE